jgi:hypothetical protein
MAKERQLSMIDRMLEQAIGKHLDVGSECEPMRASHPLLWQWLATVYVGEDYIKTPPAITITLVPGGVSARVTDRDLAKSLEVTCDSLGKVFDTLEQALNSPTTLVKILGKREPRLRKRQK